MNFEELSDEAKILFVIWANHTPHFFQIAAAWAEATGLSWGQIGQDVSEEFKRARREVGAFYDACAAARVTAIIAQQKDRARFHRLTG